LHSIKNKKYFYKKYVDNFLLEKIFFMYHCN